MPGNNGSNHAQILFGGNAAPKKGSSVNVSNRPVNNKRFIQPSEIEPPDIAVIALKRAYGIKENSIVTDTINEAQQSRLKMVRQTLSNIQRERKL